MKKKGFLWLLKKPLYGLKDAAKNWYLTLKTDLDNLKCEQSIIDHAMFSFRKEKLLGMLTTHVDDFLYSGENTFLSNVIAQIEKKYDI